MHLGSPVGGWAVCSQRYVTLARGAAPVSRLPLDDVRRARQVVSGARRPERSPAWGPRRTTTRTPEAAASRSASSTPALTTSPGTTAGMPGGYGATSSAATRPAAASAGHGLVRREERLPRGQRHLRQPGAQPRRGDDLRAAAPRCRSIAATSASTNGWTVASVSAIVTVATRCRGRPSRPGSPSATRSSSTREPVGAGARPARRPAWSGRRARPARRGRRRPVDRGEPVARRGDQLRSSGRAAARRRAPAAAGRRRCWRGWRRPGWSCGSPRRRARAGARSSRSVRASTSAAWVYAGSALCALVTSASAPAASACGGRAGWKPEVRAPRLVDDQRHAGRVRGVGERRRRRTACRRSRARRRRPRGPPGARASAARTPLGGQPRRAGRTPASTSGATHTGRSPASTKPSSIERCTARVARRPRRRAARRRGPAPGCRAWTRRPRSGTSRRPTAAAARLGGRRAGRRPSASSRGPGHSGHVAGRRRRRPARWTPCARGS